MSEHPNILVLMCDQMQARRLGVVDETAHTPNLDRLAREGVHFSQAFTEQGQCVPSRACFMTGQPAHQCGVMVNYGFFNHQGKLTAHQRTLAQVLREAGYRTAYFGKAHFGTPIGELGFEEGRISDSRDVDRQTARELRIDFVPDGLRQNYVAIEEAVDYLRDYEPDGRPLYFTFSTNLPHPPFFMDEKYESLFPPEEMELPRSFYEETFDDKPDYQGEHFSDGRHGATDEEAMRRETARYYSMIARMDEHFGRVIDEFQRLGMWEDTIVLFWADHGDMMGSHRMHVKGTLPYDELYHIPCVWKLPAGMSPARGTVDDLVCTTAFPGTLLRLAGVAMPWSFTGGHFADAFFRDRHPVNERTFFEHYAAYWGLHPFYGVRTRDAKYIRYYGPDDTEEMYDLAADPHEMHNVADRPEYADARRELAALADEWWGRTDGRTVDYYESDYFKQNRHNLEE